MALPFRDPFDQLMAGQGPPAVYTVDHKGQLGLNVERTRRAVLLQDPGLLRVVRRPPDERDGRPVDRHGDPPRRDAPG